MDTVEQFCKILAVNGWIQGGFSRHGSDNILVFRRDRAVFDLMCVALDGSATPVEGGELALSDEELEQCYQFCLHHLAAKRLPDSRLVSLSPLLWGYARLCIGPMPPLHTSGRQAALYHVV